MFFSYTSYLRDLDDGFPKVEVAYSYIGKSFGIFCILRQKNRKLELHGYTICITKKNENKKQISQDSEVPLLQKLCNQCKPCSVQTLFSASSNRVSASSKLPKCKQQTAFAFQNHPYHWVLFGEVLEYEISFTDLRATLQPLKMMSKDMFTNQQCKKLRTENQ